MTPRFRKNSMPIDGQTLWDAGWMRGPGFHTMSLIERNLYLGKMGGGVLLPPPKIGPRFFSSLSDLFPFHYDQSAPHSGTWFQRLWLGGLRLSINPDCFSSLFLLPFFPSPVFNTNSLKNGFQRSLASFFCVPFKFLLFFLFLFDSFSCSFSVPFSCSWILNLLWLFFILLDYSTAVDGTRLIHSDPWLEPFADDLRQRSGLFSFSFPFSFPTSSFFFFDLSFHNILSSSFSYSFIFFSFFFLIFRYLQFSEWKGKIESVEGGYDQFSKGYLKRGFVVEQGGIRYSEWAPNAAQAFLVGDFSEIPLKRRTRRTFSLISVGNVQWHLISFLFPFFFFFFRDRWMEPWQPPDGQGRVWCLWGVPATLCRWHTRHSTSHKGQGAWLHSLPASPFFELDFLKLGCFRSAWCCLLDRGLSVCLRGSLVLSRTRRFLHSSKVRSYPALLPLASILFPFNLLHCVDRNLLESAGEVCVETQANCPWGKHGTEDLWVPWQVPPSSSTNKFRGFPRSCFIFRSFFFLFQSSRNRVARGQDRHLWQFHWRRPPKDQAPRLQLHPAHGHHGARILRQLWLSNHKLLCHLQSLRFLFLFHFLFHFHFHFLFHFASWFFSFLLPLKFENLNIWQALPRPSRGWLILPTQWELWCCSTWSTRTPQRTCLMAWMSLMARTTRIFILEARASTICGTADSSTMATGRCFVSCSPISGGIWRSTSLMASGLTVSLPWCGPLSHSGLSMDFSKIIWTWFGRFGPALHAPWPRLRL